MSLSVLRVALLVVGIVLLAVAAALASAGCAFGLVWRVALPGVVLLLAALFERWRYKRIAGSRPGLGWVTTGERFVDPESGRRVAVYYRPETGERRYVAD